MNRIIKLRAWDIEKKKFIPEHVWAVVSYGNNGEIGVMIRNWEDYREGEHFYSEYQIIQQFTGLYDKNGKEIYEGDIIGGFCYDDGLHVVELEPRGNFWYWYGEYSHEGYHLEVVGNVHENSELLK